MEYLNGLDAEAFEREFVPLITTSSPDAVADLLRKYGVAILEDAVGVDLCDRACKEIFAAFCHLNPALADWDMWKRADELPPAVRHGLYQCLFSNLRTVWELRASEKMVDTARKCYTAFRGPSFDGSLVVSGDGINVQAPFVRRVVKKKTPGGHETSGDWAHLDQAANKDPYACVQGQVCLSTTDASFRCTPGSHLAFRDIVHDWGMDAAKDNWLKFDEARLAYGTTRERFTHWQVPVIPRKRGSAIFWLSSTIHSARGVQTSGESPRLSGEHFQDWRFVVYVCHRPLSEFTDNQLKRRQLCYTDNRVANHWTDKLFSANCNHYKPLKMADRYGQLYKEIVYQPQDLYAAFPPPPLEDVLPQMGGRMLPQKRRAPSLAAARAAAGETQPVGPARKKKRPAAFIRAGTPTVVAGARACMDDFLATLKNK